MDRWNVPETDMLPKDLDELASIRVRLLELGYSRAKVAGCLDFVLGKARGEEMPMGPTSKSQYRKMLTALRLGVGPDGSGQSGHLGILPAVTVALGLVAAVVTHRPEWLGAAPPIIRDSGNLQDERDELLNYCCEPPLLLAA